MGLKFFNNESLVVLLIEYALTASAAQAGTRVAQSAQRAAAAAGEAPDLTRLSAPRRSHLAQWLLRSGGPAEGGDQRRVYEQHTRELLCRRAFVILIDITGDHEKETCCAVGARRCRRAAPQTDTCQRRAAHHPGQGQQVFEVGLEGCDFTPIKHMPQRNLFALSGTHAG